MTNILNSNLSRLVTYQIWQVEGHFQNFNFSCWIACEAVFGFGRTMTMTIDYDHGEGYCQISIVFLAHGWSRPSKTSIQFYFACMWNCEDEVELFHQNNFFQPRLSNFQSPVCKIYKYIQGGLLKQQSWCDRLFPDFHGHFRFI